MMFQNLVLFMKRSLYIFIVLSLIIFGCSSEDDIPEFLPNCKDCPFTCIEADDQEVTTNDCLDNFDCHFRVFPDSKIILDLTEGVKEGEHLVFQMILETEGDELIFDDEFTNILVFELKNEQNSFSVSGEEIANLNVHFRTICFCGNVDFKEVKSGCLQGVKQNEETWKVQGNLEIQRTFETTSLKIDAQFFME